MTKARQLSPEGGEKCGFFLRGGHASQPQDLYRVTLLCHNICLCCCGVYLETFWYRILFGNFGDIEQIETFSFLCVVFYIDPSLDRMNTL